MIADNDLDSICLKLKNWATSHVADSRASAAFRRAADLYTYWLYYHGVISPHQRERLELAARQ